MLTAPLTFILVHLDENETRAFATLFDAAKFLVDDQDPDFRERDWDRAIQHELCSYGVYESWSVSNELAYEINDLRNSLRQEAEEEERYGSYEQQHRQVISDVVEV